ncbi:alpha/beta fold hydrolase [uncultured Fibrobacter sp.]|uniref:alpha/beta fold hydrolase n=1 Tax=uncultured Fibrobacter sp. TaxID=261512 RepID=UPI00262D5E1D|nr:alpha/beta fold hydrolase [uncultured Fibrobacter sp.]
MAEKWIWFPDFVSDLSLWEDDLVSVSPAANHSFVPYAEMASCLDNLYKINGLSKATHVVGWGLGAFALLHAASHHPQGQKWILLAPFADFGSEESNWTSQNLHFMAKQAHTSLSVVLNAFEELVQEEFGDWQEDWMAAAAKMPPDAIGAGLNFLADNRIESEIPIDPSDIQVLYGRLDQAVPPAMTLELKEFLPGVEFRERPKAGHWPPMLLF